MEPNAASKAFDIAVKNSINLARVEAGQVANVKAFLAGLETELVAILNDHKDLSPGKTQKLKTILAAAQEAITSTYKGVASGQKADLSLIAMGQTKVANAMMNAGVKVDVVGAVLTEKQLSKLVDGKSVFGHSSADWWKAQDVGLQQNFAGAIQQGYALGEDVDSLVRRVRGTKANGFTDGIMQTSRREAEALVRSSIQTISNQARMDSFGQFGDLVKGIEWVSTLDTRTTIICRALDGKIWRLPDMVPIGHEKVFPGPTAHWNCRSTQIPVMRSWAELSGKKIKSLDSATYAEKLKEKLKAKGMDEKQIATAVANARASMDGQASGSPDMEGWMKKKPDADNLAMIGPGRFELWQKGKLQISDLTDQNNRPLTIAQLHAAIDAGGFPVETEGADFIPFDPAKLKKPTANAAQAIQDGASQKIADVLANPKTKGNSIMATNLAKVQAAEPSLSPAETWAKAEEQTAAKIAANTKSSILSKAKKSMVDGGAPTPGQQALIDEMGETEKADWLASVADAKTAKQVEVMKVQATTTLGTWTDPVKVKALETAKAAGIDPADPVATLAAAQKAMPGLVAVETSGNTTAAAKKAMKALTGMDSPTVPSVMNWLSKEGKDPGEFLAEFQAVTKEKAEQSVKSSVLSKAKKKLAAGEAPTPAQQAVIDGLTPEEKTNFDEQLADVKAKAAAEAAAHVAQIQANKAAEAAAMAQKQAALAAEQAQAAAKATTAKEAQQIAVQAAQQATTAQATVPAPDKLKIVGKLGGSTGAQLAEDTDGTRYVVKRGASPDHVRTEQQADELYRALGLDVPDGAVFETATGPVKVSRFLEGSRPLSALSGKERAAAVAKLQEGFHIDALLGNWDVAGMRLIGKR